MKELRRGAAACVTSGIFALAAGWDREPLVGWGGCWESSRGGMGVGMW